MSINFVIVDGRFMMVNKDINKDFFFVLCGGGGGIYGVVILIVVKVFKGLIIFGIVIYGFIIGLIVFMML